MDTSGLQCNCTVCARRGRAHRVAVHNRSRLHFEFKPVASPALPATSAAALPSPCSCLTPTLVSMESLIALFLRIPYQMKCDKTWMKQPLLCIVSYTFNFMTPCELVTMLGEFHPHETHFFSLLKYGATSSKMPKWQLITCGWNWDETPTGLRHNAGLRRDKWSLALLGSSTPSHVEVTG